MRRFPCLPTTLFWPMPKTSVQDGEAGQEAAGTGLLDYPYYLSLLKKSGFHGPLILHGLAESQVAQAVAFVRGLLEQIEGE